MIEIENDTILPGENGPLALIPDWFLDLCADHSNVQAVYRSYAEHIVGQMAVPVKTATVRRHIASAALFLRNLAEIHPPSFDWIFTEYAERLLADACTSASGGTGQ